jgi:predicted transcriptional regulator
MNLDIAPSEQILKELAGIDAFLNITCNEQIEEVVQRGNDLSVHLARSGKLLADAKYHLDRKMKSEVFDTLKEAGKQAKASQTAVNKIIASLCAEEQYLVNWADRANRTATHQLDWLRSLLSKAKEEMRLTPAMYNNQKF